MRPDADARPAPKPTLVDLIAMRALRTRLVIATAVLQGGQYLLAPGRPLSTPAYQALSEIGAVGWRVIGVVLLLGGVMTAIRRVEWAGFVWLAFVEAFLGVAQLLNGFVPSTLILPVGLCLIETTLTSRLRRRAQKGGHGCG